MLRADPAKKKPAVSSDIAGWNNIRTRHACISNDGRHKAFGGHSNTAPRKRPMSTHALPARSEPEGGIDPIFILGTFE